MAHCLGAGRPPGARGSGHVLRLGLRRPRGAPHGPRAPPRLLPRLPPRLPPLGHRAETALALPPARGCPEWRHAARAGRAGDCARPLDLYLGGGRCPLVVQLAGRRQGAPLPAALRGPHARPGAAPQPQAERLARLFRAHFGGHLRGGPRLDADSRVHGRALGRRGAVCPGQPRRRGPRAPRVHRDDALAGPRLLYGLLPGARRRELCDPGRRSAVAARLRHDHHNLGNGPSVNPRPRVSLLSPRRSPRKYILNQSLASISSPCSLYTYI